jgi:hypothetical protein
VFTLSNLGARTLTFPEIQAILLGFIWFRLVLIWTQFAQKVVRRIVVEAMILAQGG